MTVCWECQRYIGPEAIKTDDGRCLTCRAFESDKDPLQAEKAILKGMGWSDERIASARIRPEVGDDSAELETDEDVVDVEPETSEGQAQLTDW